MRPTLDPETYVFATSDNPALVAAALATMREAEGLSLIVPLGIADRAGVRYEFPCRRITLQVHSALDAVGFLAAIVPKLAAMGMGVNPVAGFFHDHLFVPADRADAALEALEALTRESGGGASTLE